MVYLMQVPMELVQRQLICIRCDKLAGHTTLLALASFVACVSLLRAAARERLRPASLSRRHMYRAVRISAGTARAAVVLHSFGCMDASHSATRSCRIACGGSSAFATKNRPQKRRAPRGDPLSSQSRGQPT